MNINDFDYDLPNQLEAYETIKDVDVMLDDDLLGICEFTNQKKKIIQLQLGLIISYRKIQMHFLNSKQYQTYNQEGGNISDFFIDFKTYTKPS